MKNKITALLLSVVLCLSLVGNAFALETTDQRVTIDLDKAGQTVTINFTGLTAGRTYRLSSISWKSDGADAQFELLRILDNFTAGADGTASVPVEKVKSSIFTDGYTLRVNVVDVGENWQADCVIGEEKPVMVPVNIIDGYGLTTAQLETAKPIATLQVEKGTALTQNQVLAALPGGKLPTHAGYHVDHWRSGGAAVRFPLTITADSTDIIIMWAKDSTGGTTGGGSSGGGGGGGSSSQSISITKTGGGTVTCRPGSPTKGTVVRVTVHPNDGYVLDRLTVTDRNGDSISVTKVSDTEYTFVMPEGRVKVTPEFKAINTPAPAGVFPDVPASHTFYDDISWVASKGYMGGYNDGTFRPSANTTRQALWMVLARMDGANPANMDEARSWAIQNGVSDGSNPGNAMTRQQMVTMLYRYAQFKGYATTGGTSLDQFTDASAVADYAREAMSWAVGNGIVQGNGTLLNPAGIATRAHFAAFLHRFCSSVGVA